MAAHNHFGDQSMQPTAQKIDQLQVTGDTLTSRARKSVSSASCTAGVKPLRQTLTHDARHYHLLHFQ